MNRPEPSLQQTGAKRENEPGFGQIVAERSRYPLHQLVRERRLVRRKAADPDIVGRAVGFSESPPDCVPVAAVLPAENRYGMRKILGSEVRQTGGDHC